MELALLNFSSRAARRLSTTIDKNTEKCNEFYKKMCSTQNKCQASAATQVQYFPDKDQHLKNLQDKLKIDEESIQKIEIIREEEIRVWVIQPSVHKYLFKELLMQTSPKVKEIESHLSKHEVFSRLLERVDYQVIREEAHACGIFIKKSVGPTYNLFCLHLGNLCNILYLFQFS